jgi:NADH-quinone oxidoreductase subunit E
MAHKSPNIEGKSALLTPGTRQVIDSWVARFPRDRVRSAVIQSLMAAQEQNGGSLNRDLIEAVADYLDVPPVWAAEVASFYSMFDNQPVGRHKVNICTNISCWLNGADAVVAHAENKLGIGMGETTSDGRITLKIEEECLAACCGAPMMVVDGHYHENLTPERIDEILDGLE